MYTVQWEHHLANSAKQALGVYIKAQMLFQECNILFAGTSIHQKWWLCMNNSKPVTFSDIAWTFICCFAVCKTKAAFFSYLLSMTVTAVFVYVIVAINSHVI